MRDHGEMSARDVTADGAPAVVLPSSRPQSTEPDKQSGAEPSAVEPPGKEEDDKKSDQQDEGKNTNKL